MTDKFIKKTIEGLENSSCWGANELAMRKDQNLLYSLSWDNQGFIIENFLNPEEYAEFIKNVGIFFSETLSELKVSVSPTFNFSEYHKIAGEHHLDFINKIKHLDSKNFPIDKSIIEKRISDIMGFNVTNFNPTTKESVFHFRVIRPNFSDNNPIHRDTWHWEYKDNINIYVGLFGSDERTSLPIIPGSHHWNESKVKRTESGALINGIQYVVPATTEVSEEHSIIRPNPAENEVMIFSPYLLHGGAINESENHTRISLEMRFWKSNNELDKPTNT